MNSLICLKIYSSDVQVRYKYLYLENSWRLKESQFDENMKIQIGFATIFKRQLFFDLDSQ